MPTSEHDACRAVHRLFKALRLMDLGQWSERLQGLGMLDLGVLHHAELHQDGVLGDIRKALNIPHSTLTSAVNRLERKGLLRRVVSDKDRRSYGLVLTSEGREINAEHARLDRMIGQALVRNLEGEAERAEFVRLVERAAQGLE